MALRLKPTGKVLVIVLVVAILFAGFKFLVQPNIDSKKSKNTTVSTAAPEKKSGGSILGNVFGSNDVITIAVNTWTGFAPLVYMNGGSLEPNKNCRFYTEYGIQVRIKIMDVFDDCRNAFKSGDVDLVYCTTDAFSSEMGSSSGMAQMGGLQFLMVDWSRGGDLIVVRKGINTVADLKSKTVAVAMPTASSTFLIKTLETNGMQMSDVKMVKVSDGIEAAKLFKAGTVDAAVVWTPDDLDCVAAQAGSKVLVSTKVAAYVIADGVVAKKTYIDENSDKLAKFSKGWLTANGELNSNPSERAKAAQDFAKCFNVDLGFAKNGLENVRLTTYGDNLNFFGLNSAYQGMTGDQMYTKMSNVYSGLNLVKNPLPWRNASTTSIIDILGMSNSGTNAAEPDIKFTKATEDIIEKQEFSNKKVTINFETGSYLLDDDDKYIIDHEFVSIAKSFAAARVRIEGNCDAVGNPSTNQVLSEKRAQAVANYLTKEYSIDHNRFIVIGNGSRKAIEDGASGSSETYRMTEFQLVAE